MGLEQYLPDLKYVSLFKQHEGNVLYNVHYELSIPGQHSFSGLQQLLLAKGVPIKGMKTSEEAVSFNGYFSGGVKYSLQVSHKKNGQTTVSLTAKNSAIFSDYKVSGTGASELMQALRDYVKLCEQEPLTTLDSRAK